MPDLPPTMQEAAVALRARQTSAVDLLDACLRRIERFEGRVHAWVRVDEAGARAAARSLDDELARSGPRGPLHGIPIGIKDIVDVEGWPTLGGSRLRIGHRASSDAPLVARLRAAGAVLVGKTVTTEFASFDPPPTCNPWHLGRTPGGSSSGSAAAVALGMCLAAVGSQTGGSITRPAAYCGVAGCKPTYGRVSLRGVLPLSFHQDHPGPIARSVGDLAAVLPVIAGYDPLDPASVDVPVGDYAAEWSGAAGPRLAVAGGFFETGVSPDVRQAIAAAVDRLSAAGATVVPFPMPDSFADVHRYHRLLMAVEAAAAHRENFPSRRSEFGPQIASLLDEGLAAGVLDYAAALAQQRRFGRDLALALAPFDALLTPAATTTAPTPETTGDPRCNSPFSFAGVPTVSLPCGLGGDGLPVACQLAAGPWQEGRLLAVGRWCERQVGFSAQPALLSE